LIIRKSMGRILLLLLGYGVSLNGEERIGVWRES